MKHPLKKEKSRRNVAARHAREDATRSASYSWARCRCGSPIRTMTEDRAGKCGACSRTGAGPSAEKV